ncbi:snake venom 5'-nucleotidase-like [Mercenaria mercenaria]|uniref:snake venom 5'-nucleotidase-like n=1 Tax=Mercenaria mercenaria TaxID=6596 RepID=UPI00234F8EFB|nr:snake venom 5'-nucleotidase-like [Mercenaria mercenaria]
MIFNKLISTYFKTPTIVYSADIPCYHQCNSNCPIKMAFQYHHIAFYICGIICLTERSKGDYELTIVHNNDVHAHFDQVNAYSGECTDKQASDNKCYGGEARRNSFIKDARERYENTLVLDAGDRFTGTLWFNQYHGEAAATFVNMEKYDAVCLGNHEFDRGVAGLVPYLENLTVPVIDANIDVSSEPRLQGRFNATLIKEVGGVKIGLVGYITTDTAFISNAGPTVEFEDEVTAVRNEVEKLKAAGVDIVIGLSHAGYGMDKKVAREVEDIDVIVGGHSHTFLYSGPQPSKEEIEGPYPTIVTQPSGKTVLVVQAYAWGKYMGFLNVTFDEDFNVKSWSGQPVLLDKTIPQDPATLEVINKMKKPLEKIKAQIVGRTVVRLQGDPIQCRLRECNSGNLLTDSMIDYHIDKRESNDTWALAAIALLSGGGIRASTEPGDISMGQVLTVQPFGNVIDMIQLRGVHLRQAFEHSVAKYDPHDRPGAFFQMSGAHVVYDLSKPSGSRVVSLEVRCLKCIVPKYEPVDDEEIYNILMMDFTIKGGDGFTMIRDNLVGHVQMNSLDSDVFKTYLEKNNPVFADTEGRIKFVNSSETSGTSETKCTAWSMAVFVFILRFMNVF